MSAHDNTKILFLGASPDTVAVSVIRELRVIGDRLRGTQHRDQFELQPQFEVRAQLLPGLIMRFEPQLLHFTGHGSPANELVFHGPGDTALPADPRVIAAVFGALEGIVRCVVLNACYSQEQAELIAEHVDTVIGMSDAIDDDAAVAFAGGFYEALGFGRSVAQAFELGKIGIGLGASAGADVPVLHVRPHVDPAKVFIQTAPTEPPRGSRAAPDKPPRVFICYSHDSDPHRDRVLALAQRLRADGIDAWLDLFDPAPPQGWPRWMADQVQQAEFVVLVCSEVFRRRFEGNPEPGRGKGSTYEGLLASQLLYEGRLDHRRVVPVTFVDDDDLIPIVARAGTRHVLPQSYDDLRRQLIGDLAIVPVPIAAAKVAAVGLPSELNLADERSRLQDEFDERIISGEDTADVNERLRALRRQIRSGPTLQPGDFIQERYRLVARAGAGGFATVWKAHDRVRRRVVAVKVLHGQWAQDRSRVERFASGTRRMGALGHPAVVEVLETSTQDEHHHFCVMPWFEGGDLRRAVLERGLARDAALEAVARVLEGLAHAHEQGVVHRDVKPGNILLDERGRGYITDFDLAYAKDSTHGTHTAGMGTFAYAAPEQQHDASRVDARADAYSAGMCVLFALTGRDPPAFVAALKPKFLDGLSCGAQLGALLRGALAYEVEDRTTSCTDLADAIRAELRGERQAPLEPSGFVRPAHAASKVIHGVELVLIPAGHFLMGSPADEVGRYDSEEPQNEVNLASFYLARTPVTNAQYAKYLEARPDAEKPKYWADRRYNHSQQPVVGVSWDQAQAYCEWAGFNLPTEAQWEYACRAGKTTRYWFGDAEAHLDRVGWYVKNSDNRLHAVAEKQANPFGLHDMHGNVWEWCCDHFGDYSTSPRPDDGLREPVGAARRVFRGGSWYDVARVARSAFRDDYVPGVRYISLGFRPGQGCP